MVSESDTGDVLMHAEILDVEDASFGDGCIHGIILASWGVTLLEDTIADRPYLVRELGIARPFRPKPRLVPLYMEGGDFIDEETNRLVYDAPVARLIKSRAFYGRDFTKGGAR
jgi:hypothetical protein